MSKPTPGLPQKTVTGPQRLKGLTRSVPGREFCGLGSFWSAKGKTTGFVFPNLPHRAQFDSV